MTDQLHLLPKHRDILQDLLRQHLPDVEVWAYGSRVNGRSHDGSDLDLVLRGPDLNEIPAGQLGEFEEAIRESNIPFLVEARDWARLPERFHREIERGHVVLAETEHRDADDLWCETTLGEVIEFKRGYDLPQRERIDGNIPVVSSSGVIGHHRESKVTGPGVVTGRYGTLGQVFFIADDFWPLNTALYVQDFKGNDPRFISYLLKALDVSKYADKAAVPGLNRNHLHQETVRVPSSIVEQRAIAHILGTLDDRIELNRRMNETLEAMARALFKSWFVDFDPVRAKAVGSDTGLPQDVAASFPSEFIDSEVGEIPVGWTAKALEEVMEINPPRQLRKSQTAPYLDMANMPTKDHAPMGWTERPFGSGVRFVNGDTLLARITPCLENGKTAYVDFLEADQVGWGSTEYIVLRPKSPLPSEFGYFLARSSGFREFAIQCMTGSSGRQRVPAWAVSQYRLVVPPESVAENFGRLVRPLVRRASDAVRETRVLSALRDTLLPKLISGEVQVNQMERATA